MGELLGTVGFDPLGRRLTMAARAARSMFDAQLEDAGTTAAAWFVLVSLAAGGPSIQRDLARQLQIEAPTLVRHIDRLEADGLVTRGPAPTDRRASMVTLTEKGKERYRAVRARVEQMDAELSSVLTDEQRTVLGSALTLLTQRAREMHPRRQG